MSVLFALQSEQAVSRPISRVLSVLERKGPLRLVYLNGTSLGSVLSTYTVWRAQ